MKKKISLIIFDLDGVLINSKLNMEISWNKVRKNLMLKKTLVNTPNILDTLFLKF